MAELSVAHKLNYALLSCKSILLLLLPEATCLPCYHTCFSQQDPAATCITGEQDGRSLLEPVGSRPHCHLSLQNADCRATVDCTRGDVGGGGSIHTSMLLQTHVHTSCNVSSVFFPPHKVIYSSVYLSCVLCSELLSVVKFILCFSPLFCHHRLSKGRQERLERGMMRSKALERRRC